MKKVHVVMLAAFLMCIYPIFNAADLAAQETIQGTQLDPSRIGPGVIETMETAIERDLTMKPTTKPNLRELQDKHGIWQVPSRNGTTYPKSGEHYVANKWGDTSMGIGFPEEVDLKGAWFLGQGGAGTWPSALQVVGYRKGEEVQRSAWQYEITTRPEWVDLDFTKVDRIEVIAKAKHYGAAFYGIDDLTFVMDGREVVLNFDDLDFRAKLTGSDYGGLTWETGTGDYAQDEGVPAPQSIKRPPNQSGTFGGTTTASLSRATLPTLEQTFQSVIRGDAGSNSFPPDTDGAIGPNHFVVTVNRNFAVYDKVTGAELANINLGSFLPGSNGDPRVLFDHQSGRWIVLVTDFISIHFLAVSLTDDAMGSWFKTSFVATTGGDWPDYPTLGVDEYGIYSASYIVGGVGMSIFAIDKAPLVAPIPSMGTVTEFSNLTWEGAIQPAHTYGSPGGEYCISWYSSNKLRLRKINPPMTAPTMTQVGLVDIPSFSSPPLAPALGSSPALNTVDDRLMMSVYRDGSLWTCHNINVNGKVGCRWYEIDVSGPTLIQSGNVGDPVFSYWMPSIMVNKQGDVVMGFSGSHSGIYAGCYYTGRYATDPLGEMATPVQFKAGTGQHNLIDGANRNRWGDYSYTTLDPVDETTIWTIQEYGHSTDVWGTYVAKLGLPEPPLIFSFLDSVPALQPPGLANTYTLQISDGAETYVAGSGTLHYRFDGGAFQTVTVTPLGGDNYEVTLPNTQPGDAPEFYFSAQGSGGTTLYQPTTAPADVYSFDVYFEEILWEDNFETNKGWTVQNIALSDGPWDRGVPAGGGDREDPPTDADGSGSCYVTDNVDGNSDVDGGPTILTSPVIDMSSGDALISYYLWHGNDDGDASDNLVVEISNNNGGTWKTVESLGNTSAWVYRSYLASTYWTPTSQMLLRFSAIDNPNDSVDEAGVDGFKVLRVVDDATLWADGYTINAGSATVINLSLDAGAGYSNRDYYVFGSASGTSPGLPLPGGLATLPLNWDPLTDIVISMWNSPVFPNFKGTLDVNGEGSAQINTGGPIPPDTVGVTLYFAYLLNPSPSGIFDYASTPISILIEP